MPLRRADTSQTERFEDGGDWLELRTQLTAGEEGLVAEKTGRYRMTAETFTGALSDGAEPMVEVRMDDHQAYRTLFSILAVGWSMSDKPSAADFDALDRESKDWVCQCIDKARAIHRERAEKNAPSSKKRASSRSSSAQAAASGSPT